MKTFLALLWILLSGDWAKAQSYTANDNLRGEVAVPAGIAKAFHNLVLVADSIVWKGDSWETGKGVATHYRVLFKQDGLTGYVAFSADGLVSESLLLSKLDTLPLVVQRAINKAARKYRRKWPQSIVKVQTKTNYSKEGERYWIGHRSLLFMSAAAFKTSLRTYKYTSVHVLNDGNELHPLFRW